MRKGSGQLLFLSHRSGKTGLFTVDVGSGILSPLVLHENDIDNPIWSPDGSQIVYRVLLGDYWDIFTVDADGRNRRNLTRTAADDESPSWSPDGRRIVFESWRDGDGDIYVMDADGANVRRLTDHPAFDGDPVWSPDGEWIAFVAFRTDTFGVYLIDPEGSDLRYVSANLPWASGPVWSAAGDRVAFVAIPDRSSDLYVTDLARGGAVQRLTAIPVNVRDPAWSSDGQRLAVTMDQSQVTILIVELDNPLTLVAEEEAAEVMTIDGPISALHPAWSPDGKRLALTTYGNGTQNIAVIDVDGHNLRPLTDHHAADWLPLWRPEGKP
jgi:TolB protein